MKLFLDTEFTDLIPGAKLISIALVDENENYFYAELTDTYELKDCSVFVKHFVLPFLKSDDKYKMSFHECSLAIGNWIEDRDAECIIASDNPSWDLPYLEKLLEPLWPANLNHSTIFPVHLSTAVKDEIVITYNYDIHNALDDALVMKKGILNN